MYILNSFFYPYFYKFKYASKIICIQTYKTKIENNRIFFIVRLAKLKIFNFVQYLLIRTCFQKYLNNIIIYHVITCLYIHVRYTRILHAYMHHTLNLNFRQHS